MHRLCVHPLLSKSVTLNDNAVAFNFSVTVSRKRWRSYLMQAASYRQRLASTCRTK